MRYKDLPIFRGITPEIEAYLDKLDAELSKNKQKIENLMRKETVAFDDEEIFLRKVDFYYSYLSEKNDDLRRKKKNQKSKFQENIDRIFTNLSGNRLYHGQPCSGSVRLLFLMNGIYNARRTVIYPKPMSAQKYSNIMDEWKNKKNGLNVIVGDGSSGGWIFKIDPVYKKNKKQGKPTHRFILNVNPSSELLDKLDEFAKKYHCQYKCAETLNFAYSRPDTIVIYTADERIKEQKRELSEIIKPWVRKKGDNYLDGERISAGLYTAKETDRKELEALFSKLQKLAPRTADWLKKEMNDRPDSPHPLSLGQVTIYKDLYESFKMLKGQSLQHVEEKSLTSASEDDKEAVDDKNRTQATDKSDKDFTVNPEQKTQQPEPRQKKEPVSQPEPREKKEPTKVVADEQITETKTTPAKSPVDDAFKEPWRKFYQHEAAKEKSTYQEDKDSENYKASLLRQNGEKLEITATPQHHVSLTAKDKDNKSKIPDYGDFNKLVLAAKEQGKTISFGNIKSPEFRARLMLACLENNVDMKTLPEFGTMQGLETETRERLMKHKVKLLKRMVQDKEKTGDYSGLSPEEQATREKLEQHRKVVREGRKNKQTDTPEFNAAQEALKRRRQSVKQ